jgi:hypothetical protein
MLVLALKFSRSWCTANPDDKRRPEESGRFVSSWEQTLPENGTERLSKLPGPGLRPWVPWSHRSKLRCDDQ